MSDDLFDNLDPNDAATGGSEGKPKPAASAPKGGGDSGSNLEAMLGQLANGLQEVGTSLRSVNSRLDRVEKGITVPTKGADGKQSDVLTELMNDPDNFFAQRVGGVVQEQLKQIVPFLETVADGVTTSARERTRAQFDRDMGAGAFDQLVGDDLDKALKELPAASRVRGDYVNALVAGILGGKVMSEDGRKMVSEVVRKARDAARPPAPVLLPGGGRSPAPRDSITDAEKVAIDSLRRSGIEFSEKAFLEAKSMGSSEEDWGSDWAKSDRYWEGDAKQPDKSAKPDDGAAPEAV